MSAGGVLVAGVVAAVRAGVPGVAVFDAAPVRGGLPHVVVGEPVLTDWSARGVDGREARIVLGVRDGGERPVRLRALMGQVEAAMDALVLGEGWRVATCRFVRSRIAAAGEARFAGSVEFVVRLYRTQ